MQYTQNLANSCKTNLKIYIDLQIKGFKIKLNMTFKPTHINLLTYPYMSKDEQAGKLSVPIYSTEKVF